jgi:thiosulfate dehydrogenase (quinone) large subunit
MVVQNVYAMKNKYSAIQLTALVTLRFLIGWHFFYEGFVKLINPDWTSASYLLDSKGFLSGFFFSLANNSTLLGVVDFLNEWGLLAIGLGLMLGFLTRIATMAGVVLLAFYYLSHPPFVGITFLVPSEGSYLVVNKTLIELVALTVLYLFPTGRYIGLDRLICKKENK